LPPPPTIVQEEVTIMFAQYHLVAGLRGSLNHRRKMKADPSWLISRKLAANLELSIVVKPERRYFLSLFLKKHYLRFCSNPVKIEV